MLYYGPAGISIKHARPTQPLSSPRIYIVTQLMRDHRLNNGFPCHIESPKRKLHWISLDSCPKTNWPETEPKVIKCV